MVDRNRSRSGSKGGDNSVGPPDDAQLCLPLGAQGSFLRFSPTPTFKRPANPIWTENKAKLIERYLYYFVLITRHGTYIDGFAGPQRPENPEMWAAKLVLESEPRWFRHYHLYDVKKNQVELLRQLRDSHYQAQSRCKRTTREVCVTLGDFNILVQKLLQPNKIGEKEATFCLLDQRTFECHWTTVKTLSEYKRAHKIELFYFLAHGWIRRALSAVKNEQILANWWGRDDWSKLREMSAEGISEAFCSRIKDELGYKSVVPWPIYERESGGEIMYYMIHATDHPEAPYLMSRAYAKAVRPKESARQLGFEFVGDGVRN